MYNAQCGLLAKTTNFLKFYYFCDITIYVCHLYLETVSQVVFRGEYVEDNCLLAGEGWPVAAHQLLTLSQSYRIILIE